MMFVRPSEPIARLDVNTSLEALEAHLRDVCSQSTCLFTISAVASLSPKQLECIALAIRVKQSMPLIGHAVLKHLWRGLRRCGRSDVQLNWQIP